MTDKIYVLDNGSIESQLIRHEFKDQYDIEPVKVTGTDLVQQFTKLNNKDRIKIFLPFYTEQLAADNELLRRQIQKVEALGFKNLIVLPYEGQDEKTIKYRAKNAGLIEDKVEKGVEVAKPISEPVKEDEQGKPYTTVRTGNTKQV